MLIKEKDYCFLKLFAGSVFFLYRCLYWVLQHVCENYVQLNFEELWFVANVLIEVAIALMALFPVDRGESMRLRLPFYDTRICSSLLHLGLKACHSSIKNRMIGWLLSDGRPIISSFTYFSIAKNTSWLIRYFGI